MRPSYFKKRERFDDMEELDRKKNKRKRRDRQFAREVKRMF
ncbi:MULTISPECIES: hypothetical protein [unclassified Vibrio]|uniref:Uncharacterized protein n=1 Tax=Vibrio sp. HB236076 TaxID=3232307 RepID=A0AB39HD26_9VIBR|nr:hypothetical protein [Vibrio sp. HB161653]MDP5253351.1 hypothetical protein [Vibrio sp. HB161653]